MGGRLLIYNYYTIYYNAVQHPYNKIKRKFDIKKALHKRHLEYLRFYNCRTTGLDQLKEKVDLGVGELETLQSVMDEIKAMNKEYASYSGAPEGATVTSRYVFRTKEESSK